MLTESELRVLFEVTAEKYSRDRVLIKMLWSKILKQYHSKTRHYHNIVHLTYIFSCLNDVKSKIEDWDSVVFAVFYHDFNYSIFKKDNEEKSAMSAGKELKALGFPADQIERVKSHILATKHHRYSNDQDTNLFTDADLAILGGSHSEYQHYKTNVRQEYAWYPDVVYKAGRKQVLNHFLTREKIFNTDYFQKSKEHQAALNLKTELNALG